MVRYDVAVIGAGLGGLTAAAILARAGRKVLVVERSNSVGGAASSYKVGDLFVEGSLHETSDPRDPRDPKHDVLTRAGVLDVVQWVSSGALYEVRGGGLDRPFLLPDNHAAAAIALTTRFPHARDGLGRFLDAMRGNTEPNRAGGHEASTSLAQKLDDLFGDDEAVKCAVAANLSYYHDDPNTLSFDEFALAQGRYLASGGCYVQGGSQRLSSALARAIKTAGGDIALRRIVSAVAIDGQGGVCGITHTAKDGSDPKSVQTSCVVSNAAPETLAALLPPDAGSTLTQSYAGRSSSISLFALTLGLSRPPRDFGVSAYSTQVLPPWMTRLADYRLAARLMSGEPGDDMPPLSIADYAAIDSGVPAPPFVLSVFGPDQLANWDPSNLEDYRARRGRWQDAIVRYLDGHYPGLAGAVTASSFNTALSVRQYLNAPAGAVYGFAPSPATVSDAQKSSPRTVVPGLYLSSAYAGSGGYTGVIEAAGVCADMILGRSTPAADAGTPDPNTDSSIRIDAESQRL